MPVSAAKNNILKKIRQALATPVPLPFPQSENAENVFQPPSQEPALEFAENFTKLQGKFVYCANEMELMEQVSLLIHQNQYTSIYCKEQQLIQQLQSVGVQTQNKDLSNCHVAITTCEKLIARTGSIVLSSAQESGRNTSVYAPVHFCIAYTNQIVFDIKDALQHIQHNYAAQLPSLITVATGPSRTADIEKTLVVGVHGPKEVYCFLVEEQ